MALATVSAVVVPAPGPTDAAASMVLAQPAVCPGIGSTPTNRIAVNSGVFDDAIWALLCDGIIELPTTTSPDPELTTTGTGYAFNSTASVTQSHLLTWLNRVPGISMGGLTNTGHPPPFWHGTNIRREEAAASFVTAFRLTRQTSGRPPDSPTCPDSTRRATARQTLVVPSSTRDRQARHARAGHLRIRSRPARALQPAIPDAANAE